MVKSLFLICFLWLMLYTSGYGQVYNYFPVSYFNIETNPTVLTSSMANGRIKLIQKNALSAKHPFSYSSLRLSKRFNSKLVGVGLSINNTSLGESVYYNHIAVGVGYRNILLNKVYLKLGASCKLIDAHPGSSSFDYFSYTPSSTVHHGLTRKLNLAVSLTGESEQYYLSVSSLNLGLPWNKTDGEPQFPRYYILNIGNLMNLFYSGDNNEVSYLAMSKNDPETHRWKVSHYVNLEKTFPVSRRLTLKYGSRIGFLDEACYHLIPFVTVFQNKWSVNALYNFHLDKKTFNTTKQSTIQIALLYIL